MKTKIGIMTFGFSIIKALWYGFYVSTFCIKAVSGSLMSSFTDLGSGMSSLFG